MKKKQVLPKVLTGTLILSLAGLVSKILSAIYRVPFQNLVGDVGFYTYQQVYPFYGLEVTLALSGLPVFISRLVAEQSSEERQRAVAQRCWWILAVCGVLLTLFLWIGAPWLASGMGDHGLTKVICGLAPVFLIMPWLAVGRGYAQGQLEMRPTAFSQVGEQVVRVSIIIAVAILAWQNHWNVYHMGMLAMSSAPVAALVALAILVPIWRQLWRPLPTHLRWRPAWSQLVKRFLKEGLLLCWLASLMVVLQLVDSFTVKRGLVASGIAIKTANSLKGIFDRGQPLVQLGLVVATSFSASLLPTLAEHWRKGEMDTFAQAYHVLNHVALVMAELATAGLVFLMPQINQLLFVTRHGSGALAMLMLSIPLVTVISMDCSVLQSTNQFRPMVVALATGLLIKCVINSVLVEALGIFGASLGTVISLSVTAIITRWALPELLKQRQQGRFDLQLFIIALIMGTAVYGFSYLLQMLLGGKRLAMIVILIITIPLGVVIAWLLTMKMHLLSREEWSILPGGHKILSMIKKRG